MLYLATYSSLFLTVVLLWFPKTRYFQTWWISAILSVLFGLIAGQLSILGFAILFTFVCFIILFTYATNSSFLLKIFLGGAILCLSTGLANHTLPGFHNLKIIEQLYVSSNGLPLNLYMNIDKAFMGIFIIGFTHPRINQWQQFVDMIKQAWPLWVITLLISLSTALALGFVRFDPKLPAEFPIWFLTNLFFTCLAEEAFFRGFIQKNLNLSLCRLKSSSLISIPISGILFGLAHNAGGWKYILLATVSGIGYGATYHKTQRIEASIIAHSLLNTCHFLFFTYPALKYL